MNCRKLIEKLTGKSYFDESITHQEKWMCIVNLIGLGYFEKLLPDAEKLAKYYTVNEYFNDWFEFSLSDFERVGRRLLRDNAKRLDITSASPCDFVCLSKSAARQLAINYLKDNEYLTEHWLFN